MDKVFSFLKPFKVPLIIIGSFLLILFGLTVVFPIVKNKMANKTPIVSIEATNDKFYKSSDEIKTEDFNVVGIHEDGKKTNISSDKITIDKTDIEPVGKTTKVILTYTENEKLTCEVKVQSDRRKIVGFQCGYPNVKDVIAVLYTNGELCFEGEGDVLVFNEGEYPWQGYVYDGEEQDEENPYTIRTISFQKGVKPTNMNYWFEGMQDVTFCANIPSSVKTMVRTFKDCPNMKKVADWSKDESLLNINECYSGCTSLYQSCELPSSVRTARNAFSGCIELQDNIDLTNATKLVNGNYMFSGCNKLLSCTLPESIKYMDSMFEGCINFKTMPEIPVGVKKMNATFKGCVSLTSLSNIPETVTSLESCFENCEIMHGELRVDNDCQSFNGMFTGAAVATQVNLVGESFLLDVYANTSDSENIFVNGVKPDPKLTSYEDVFASDD